MSSIQLGLVLMTGESPDGSHVARWSEIRDLAVRAESMALDTVWVIDELLYRLPDRPAQGFWDGVAMAGAVAASTSRIKVGTWVMSALHRNAGSTAKIVETLDEISDGRFVFGLGAGHAWPGQAHAFGLPEDHIHARFDESLRIIVPLLRDGRADFGGTYHAAHDLEHRPTGPRPGRIPLMIGGHGPKMLRLAATHADIWSAYSEQRDDVAEFLPKLAALEAACAEVGRDPATMGKSAGISVAPLPSEDDPGGSALRGNAEALADAILAFDRAGFTQLEFILQPQSMEALDAMAPVIEAVRKQ
jgi:alkanesulfonate monooxygenase SsuD/methylene tetrahydromethanopterin reductase-like flavin-dependent oxidoreductase (luciferase family)